jgi:ParB family transcriptional regulator, chromosome partitioning protein
MKLVEISLEKLQEAPWNPNREDATMLQHLEASIRRYGLVEPLVVRPAQNSHFEVLSGNHRLKILRSLGLDAAPCVVVDLNDQEARLLAQALNSIHGQDDLSHKSKVLQVILAAIPADKVISLLPESMGSLRALSSLGQEDLALHLQAWQKAQEVKLKHMILQFTGQQLSVVEEAINWIMAQVNAKDPNNPNTRSNAIYLLCKDYIDRRSKQ